MTLPTTANTRTYTGDGSTDAFSFPYLFYDADHLVVTVGGVEKTNITDYTVSGEGNDAGGTVTFVVPPANSSSVIIQRIVPYDQQTDLENFDGNPSDVTEKQFDLIVMQTQQLAEIASRSATVPIGGTLTLQAYSADRLWSWSPSDSGTVVNSSKTLTQVEAAVDAVVALSSGSGVLISPNDTTVGYLNGKIVAGNKISLTENNNGSNETLTIAVETLSLSDISDAGTMAGEDADDYDTSSEVDVKIEAIAGLQLQSISSTVSAQNNSTTFPASNTAVTSSDGSQIWSQAITLGSAGNKVRIEGIVNIGASATTNRISLAVFRGTTLIYITPYIIWSGSVPDTGFPVPIIVPDAPGSTGPHTYSIRIGVESGDGGSWYVGSTGTARFGGQLALNQLTVTEISQ